MIRMESPTGPGRVLGRHHSRRHGHHRRRRRPGAHAVVRSTSMAGARLRQDERRRASLWRPHVDRGRRGQGRVGAQPSRPRASAVLTMAKRRIDLDGAVVLVTGAGGGIGAATARAFAERGSRCSPSTSTRSRQADRRGVPSDRRRRSRRLLRRRRSRRRGRPDCRRPRRTRPARRARQQRGRGPHRRAPRHDLCRLAMGPQRQPRRPGALPTSVRAGHDRAATRARRERVVRPGVCPRATEPAYVAAKSGLVALRDRWPTGADGALACRSSARVSRTPTSSSTRFVGRRDDPVVRARTAGLFRRGHPPAKVAAAIIDAVDRDRPVVFVGWEARMAWALHRAAPRASTAPGDGPNRRPARPAAVEWLPIRWRRHHVEVGQQRMNCHPSQAASP